MDQMLLLPLKVLQRHEFQGPGFILVGIHLLGLKNTKSQDLS